MDMTTELMAALQSMDPAEIEAALAGLGAILFAAIAGVLIRYLMHAIGYAAMYRKAGVAGWKAFIPVYNTYNNYKISWNGKMFFLYAAMYILLSLFGGTQQLLVSLMGAAGGIALLVIAVMQNVKMAKAFGKGAGTGIALILFPGITSMILGLGKAEFIGIEA